MGQMLRGYCSWCHGFFPVLESGKMRQHKAYLGVGIGHEICPGSGFLSAYEEAKRASQALATATPSEESEGAEPRMMLDTWGRPVEDHLPEDCYPCRGAGVYKLPLGAPGDGREIEDEDNCYCDCHATHPRRTNA